jgi:hypothetical protein
MKPTSIANPFASKGEFLEPSLVSKPNHSSRCELHPSLKAMVRALPFLGHENENPPSSIRLRGNVFVPEHLKHDIRNTKVGIVSLFSHGKDEEMVHVCHRKYDLHTKL